MHLLQDLDVGKRAQQEDGSSGVLNKDCVVAASKLLPPDKLEVRSAIVKSLWQLSPYLLELSL